MRKKKVGYDVIKRERGKKKKAAKTLSQSAEMMWKLFLHRSRRHLLDAAPVFVVCVKSASIMFISLSLIRAQSHSNTAFSDNSCRLSVTLFVVPSQFVTFLLFKVQLLSEIMFAFFVCRENAIHGK